MKQVIIGLLLIMVGVFAQTPLIPFAVGNPPAASVIGVSYNNYVNPAMGGNSYFYWVVTSYAGGSVLYPTSYEIDNINGGDPSGGYPITVSFNPVQGATGYSILRTISNIPPSFPCTCLVGTTSGATYVVDLGLALGVFSPSLITPTTGDIRLNNRDYTPPEFESTVNGVTTPLGGGGGGSYVPYTGAVAGVNLGAFPMTASSFSTNGATSGVLTLSGSVSGAVTQTVNNVAGSWGWTWPSTAGTLGYLLSTNGAGVGSWVAPSTVNVKNYGAIGNGVADDYTSIANALAGVSNGKVVMPSGTYLVKSNITINSHQELDCADSSIYFYGAIGITLTGSKAKLSNCHLFPATGYAQVWLGAKLNSCNECDFDRVAVYQPVIGLDVVGSDNNRGTLDIYNYKTKGIYFESGNANGNTFIVNEITGNSVAGSIGVHNYGLANTIIGPEISYAGIGIKNQGNGLIVQNAFVEANLSTGIWAVAGSSMRFDGVDASSPDIREDNSLIDTGGKGYTNFGNQPNHRISFNNLSGYYSFSEGVGTVAHDSSGNANHATLHGTASWVSGPYGGGILLTPNGAGYLTIPTTALTVGASFTVGVLMELGATTPTDNTEFLSIGATTGTQEYHIVSNSSVLGLTQYPNNSVSFNLGQEITSTTKWTWQFFVYDPVGGTLTGINPGVPPAVVSHAALNPFTGSITSIIFESSSINTSIKIGQIAIWNGRSLTIEESQEWINSPQSPVVVSSGGSIPVGVMGGYCTGVITSATTVNLAPFVGNNTTCTGVSAIQGMPLLAHTIKNLAVRVVENSATAGSGVVTVMKNGVATALTCTLGTLYYCYDQTHSFTTSSALDLIKIVVQSTAISGDTLGDIYATFEIW
jgi:hypothetical protein